MSETGTKEGLASRLSRQARIDVALALAAGLANLVVLLFCWRTIGVQSDESMNIYGALRILDGAHIYRDFWVYHTPGIFFLTAAAFAVFGKSIFAIRLVLILAASATASGLYLLGRKFMGALPSVLASILFIVLGVNLWPVAGYHWYSTLTLVFAVLLAARFIEDRSRWKSLFAGGLLAGTTFLFQQPKGGYLICLMFLFLAADELLQKDESPRLRRVLSTGSLFATGACAPVIVAAVYFACVGTFGEAVSATIVYPMKLLSQTGGESGYGGFYGSLTERALAGMAGKASFLGSGTWAVAVTTFLLKYVAPLSIFAAAGIWIAGRLRGREDGAIAALCSMAGLAAFGSALQRPDFFHLLTTMAPCYLTLAYVLHRIAVGSTGARFAAARRVTAFIIGALLAISGARILAGELAYASGLKTVSLGSPLGFVSVQEEKAEAAALGHPILNVIDFIQLNTGAEDTIFVTSYSPFFYYLAERRNPTPYLDIPSSPCVEGAKFHVFKLGEASFNLERLSAAARALDSDKTPLVVLDPAAACQVRPGWDEAGRESEPLIDYIRRHYSIAFDNGAFVVMTRRD